MKDLSKATEPNTVDANADPRVTILSPYFNRAHAVESTLMSISRQTYENFEALIWDDCSSDGTWQELERVRHAVGDSRITTYRHSENIGLTAGLNRAIARTRGDFVAIVGSGDWCHPDRIRAQVDALLADEHAVFCATASRTSDPVRGTTFLDDQFGSRVITRSDIESHCPFTHGSVMYRRSALLLAGDYEETFRWCADWDMFFRLLALGHAAYSPRVLYERVAQPDGVSFAPTKAIDQIQHKHLALKLSDATAAERHQILTLVRKSGLEEALVDRRDDVARDVARRNVKLYLMGRREPAMLLSRLAAERGLSFSAKYRAYILASRLVSRLGLSGDHLIRMARALPK